MATNYFDGNGNGNSNGNGNGNGNGMNGNKHKRPQFSYDDILSGLNLQVSPDGVLQKMTIKHNTVHRSASADDISQYPDGDGHGYGDGYGDDNQFYSYGGNSNSNYNSNYNSSDNIEHNNVKQPLDPSVKNSAIYNKYFKNYRDAETVVEPRVPKSWEEYHQMVREDHINRINARRRASQIKSTKMFYTASNNMQHFTKNYYMNPSHRMNGRNRLFKL